MIFLLYPHQLFQDIKKLKNKKVVLIEEPLFFTQYKFHLQKLVMHRASMKYYEKYLQSHQIDVKYFEDDSYLEKYKNEKIFIYDVVDDWLLKKIKNNFLDLTIYKSPNFLDPDDDNRFFHKYYINRRKQLNLFIDEDQKPFGGKWSFDAQNRKKLPKKHSTPAVLSYSNRYIEEAIVYCERFSTIGSCEQFYYPITFDEAFANLNYFLRNKFENYGTYQDAIVKEKSFLYHANISSSFNIGLLSLNDILKAVEQYDVAYNSKEGFVRQIIGWREFMLTVYKNNHIKLRTANYFEFSKKIPQKLLSGNSGLLPVDDSMQKLHKTAYNHHIERLMILGNIFLLLEITPDEVYEFFMASYIDAYDWVMIGNVYGMSGFSDGGSITTKPYISSSNYIIKMSSDYKKSEAWSAIWDGLYWRFLDKYQNLFQNNHRMKMQLALLKKMDPLKLEEHKKNANAFIKSIE